MRALSKSGARGRGRSAERGLTLIELLVTISILGVLTTMILVSWFALQKSFAFSLKADDSRQAARDAVSRMTVAIRDSQDFQFTYSSDTVPAISTAEADRIVFNTSYQRPSNASVPTTATASGNHSVAEVAFVYVPSSTTPTNGAIYYVTDTNGNGLTNELASTENVIANGRLVIKNVVNNVRPPGSSTPVFMYTYFADDGAVRQTTSMSGAGVSTSRIFSVQIHVLVDLDPSHAPVYMDIQSTAQPRNMRPQT